MKGWIAASRLAALLFLVAIPALARPLTDAAGRRVELPDHVARVLAAGPPAAVLLYTLAPDLMAGWVSAPSAQALPYLAPRAATLPAYGRITGRGGTANVEAVIAAQPDLIVDAGSLGATYASLADRVQGQTGIPYILLDGRFAAIPESYRTLGLALGRPGEGEALGKAAGDIIAGVTERVVTVPADKRPRVYYARGPRGLETGFTGSINTEILELAGGRNAAEGGDGRLGGASLEQVLAWDPDAIITLDPGFAASLRDDPLWRNLRAVKDGRVYVAPLEPFPWFDAPPGVNRLIGLRWLAGVLHPALFPEPLAPLVRDFYRRFYHVDLAETDVAALLAPGSGGSR